MFGGIPHELPYQAFSRTGVDREGTAKIEAAIKANSWQAVTKRNAVDLVQISGCTGH